MSRIVSLIVMFTATALLSACGSGPGNMPPEKVGKPYVIGGKTYYPSYDPAYDRTGEASWYGPGFHGKMTASGEKFDENDYTAAHPTLPMPSLVRVTNLKNGKSLVVRVNDRGPFAKNRIIDLSKKSAQALGISGVSPVRVQFLGPETQDYMMMVRDNGNKIVPMADYHAKASSLQYARAAKTHEPEFVESSEIAAPVMTVAVSPDPAAPPPVEVASAEPAPYSTQPVRLFGEVQAATPGPSDTVKAPAPVATADLAPPPATTPAPSPWKDPNASQMSSAAPSSGGNYTIQAGSFSSEDNARKLADRLASVTNVFIEETQAAGRTWWRVRAGSFASKGEAQDTLEQVRTMGVPDARTVRK